ncbi:hypothetical protein [Streptomyces sp. NPDC002215]|uniref:hypothetical protein n=1 Tax=Streptomyces sp. NPDC002215 TaxID=3154412 RepID=UPI003324E5FA
MIAEPPRAVLERLRAVDWYGDWDMAASHSRSRALLMREHMRRAAARQEARREIACAGGCADVRAANRRSPQQVTGCSEMFNRF